MVANQESVLQNLEQPLLIPALHGKQLEDGWNSKDTGFDEHDNKTDPE